MKEIRYLCIVFTLFISQAAFGSLVLDQAYNAKGVGGQGIDSLLRRSQTFTVGVGGQLSIIEVQVLRLEGVTDQLTLELRQTDTEGRPLGPAGTVASVGVPAGTVSTSFEFVPFDISDFDIQVEPGDILAALLRSEVAHGSGYYAWATQFSDQYPNGMAFPTSSSGSWDFGFRTFVRVPEPAALALMGLALAGIGYRLLGGKKAV